MLRVAFAHGLADIVLAVGGGHAPNLGQAQLASGII